MWAYTTWQSHVRARRDKLLSLRPRRVCRRLRHLPPNCKMLPFVMFINQADQCRQIKPGDNSRTKIIERFFTGANVIQTLSLPGRSNAIVVNLNFICFLWTLEIKITVLCSCYKSCPRVIRLIILRVYVSVNKSNQYLSLPSSWSLHGVTPNCSPI